MQLSQKSYYALRALFELARQGEGPPLPIARIAEEQAIPAQFLQTILRELKQGGFVQSRRGKDGGYRLARRADEVTVGEVLRFVEGDITPVPCVDGSGAVRNPERADGPFLAMWQSAARTLNAVFDGVTLASLVADHRARRAGRGDYVI